jgi:hypothetical protein
MEERKAGDKMSRNDSKHSFLFFRGENWLRKKSAVPNSNVHSRTAIRLPWSLVRPSELESLSDPDSVLAL